MRLKSPKVKATENESQPCLVDQQQLAINFDIPLEDLVILTDAALLPVANTSAAAKDCLFNLNEVADYLLWMSVHKNIHDYVDVPWTSAIFQQPHTHYGQLVKLIIKNVIEGYIPNGNLRMVKVARGDLDAFIAMSLHDRSFFEKHQQISHETQQAEAASIPSPTSSSERKKRDH
jgi:hypothetical protein